MIYNLEKMMVDILDNWDNSIFYYGGDTSSAGYTDEQYKLLGYKDKSDFQTDDFFEEFSFQRHVQGHNIGIGEMFSNDDKDLLIKHGDCLFNLIKEKKTIYRYMLKLALHFNRYRYLQTRAERINRLNKKVRKSPKKNYSQKEKEKKLKKLAEDMILLMGGDRVVYEGVTDVLERIRDNPHVYILKKHSETVKKDPIKSFLFSLNLKKPKEIESFITDIK